MRNVLSGFLLLLFPLRFLTICGFGFLANLLPRSLRLASILSSGCSHCSLHPLNMCIVIRPGFAVGVSRYLTSLLFDAYTPKPRNNPSPVMSMWSVLGQARRDTLVDNVLRIFTSFATTCPLGGFRMGWIAHVYTYFP